ncbi:CRP/FNR family transcriptional regulator, anaerobic regulatory protein [Catalinimonas alkaloidigena]|uniref:CRP/FNR family transcriptional regulator, anaerobic regulatory protein n=1 Tax=Catalinimonas alkaloidigena TaxID=1075417 RepID=A0A1G9P094_9BACT|nr:Crp/Fnr family transcriptional regulator [Catalinimonas alkaloidigena]SDL92021.1 CRP/FNR family transcriptional regulator, anaerobic regulatory protein [Catalinimonas alkaloidigena]
MHENVTNILHSLQFEERLIEEMMKVGRLKKVKEGAYVIAPGGQAREIPMVIEGTLKVMRQAPDAGELFLYYLEGGETCAMSITCCLEHKKSEFSAIAEEDSLLWMIPVQELDGWITKYESFRKFVFRSYQARFDELLQAIDAMAFLKLDERLFKYLLDKKQASGSFVIHKTHEQIANELNSSRVVISRLLKRLEQEGKIEQHRNRIEVL